MSGVLLVLHAEAYRLLHARTTWVGGAFLALVAGLRVLAARVAQTASRAEALAAGRSNAGELENSAWGPFVDGWRAGLAAATILLLVHAATTLAADRESGVLRLSVTRSSTRAATVIGRALLAPVFVVCAVVVTGVAAWAASSAFYEFGPLVEDGYELLSKEELLTELRRAALAVLPPLLATYCYGLFVSAFSRSATSAVGVALSSWLAFDLFKDVLGPSQYWVFASFTPSLVDGSAMQEMAGVARGYSDAGFAEGLYRMNMTLPWPEGLLLVALACWILSRRAL
jgi:ABC-type transport system involved in multi-copper enzyme maturation permease subunit